MNPNNDVKENKSLSRASVTKVIQGEDYRNGLKIRQILYH